jgi:thiol-disulfide isomerase/thioredoxin
MKKITNLLIALIFFCGQNFCQKLIYQTSAIIEGQFEKILDDTIRLEFFYEKFGLTEIGAIEKKQFVHDGHFKFSIGSFDGPCYFILSSQSINSQKHRSLYLDSYIAEPGDSVFINVTNDAIKFSGAQIEKYKCRYSIDTLKLFDPKSPRAIITIEARNKDVNNELIPLANKQGFNKQIAVLENYRPKIPDLIYQTMKCDLICKWARDRYNWYGLCWPGVFVLPDSISRKQKMIAFYDSNLNIEPDVSQKAKMLSSKYPDLVIIKNSMKSKIELDSPSLNSCRYVYGKIKKYPGDLGEKLIASYLSYCSQINGIQEFDSCLEDALRFVKDKYCLTILTEIQKTTSRGSDAFQFSLMDINKKLVSLKSFKNKVVLIDFWFTGCAACLACAPQLKKVIEHFKNNNKVIFMSISVDKDYNTWIKSVKEDSYASPTEEINLFTNGEGWSHKLLKYYNIDGFPFLLLISKDGKLFSSSPPRPDDINGVDRLIEMINQALLSE